MRRLRSLLAVIGIVFGYAALAAEPRFTGRFLGSGRACYGTLAVNAKTVTWLTSFSQCQAIPVELVERDNRAGILRLTYRFTYSVPSCQFRTISLTHNGEKDEDTGWQVTGYASEARFLEDKASGYVMNAPDMMSCSLIRDPGKNGGGDR